MYIHPKLVAFTDRLEALFREVDGILEDRWGDQFPLHPNRPGHGQTSSPESDGLFEIAPDFTLGIGSEYGRGYLISLRVATLETVPAAQLELYMKDAAIIIQERLPVYFPGRDLTVVRDGKRYKIIGDFSLGST